MQTYIVKFEDIFSFATSTREVNLTTQQLQKAQEDSKNKKIVVDKLIKPYTRTVNN